MVYIWYKLGIQDFCPARMQYHLYVSNRVKMDQNRQTYTMRQEIFKKMLGKYGKSPILIAS